jgi:hypothetical protein
MSTTNSNNTVSSGGCLGCFIELLGIALVVLFFQGACAADPSDSGIGHDFKKGFSNVVSFFSEVVEDAKSE